jgi:indolepyruvate ferredoxin oxidoreductase beta subunit
MNSTRLSKDPYSVIITGVGGQGNVMASRVLGSMLVNNGFLVTIGETFGASQRGGSVMSHLRISETSSWSPQIPKGTADIIVSLEPIEAVRVLAAYGNPGVILLSNTRPIFPVNVIKGDAAYPSVEELKKSVRHLIPHSIFIEATEEALKMGNPILANIIMLGAVVGLNILPITRENFRTAIGERVSPDTVDLNMDAFDLGSRLGQQ